MTQEDWLKIGIALGICYAAFRFSGNAMVKGAAAAVGATIIARQLPYVGPALGA